MDSIHTWGVTIHIPARDGGVVWAASLVWEAKPHYSMLIGSTERHCAIHVWVFLIQSASLKLGLRMKEHRKEVDSFTAGTQTRASRARESSITHKSAITDHAVEENHVIDWDSAEVVAREAQRQTRWIKEALWIRKTPTCMNRETGSDQLSHTWDQVISGSRAPSRCRQSTRR